MIDRGSTRGNKVRRGRHCLDEWWGWEREEKSEVVRATLPFALTCLMASYA